MLNKETALAFNDDVCDGFVQPTLAWSATTPYHVNANIGSGITCNFWVGNPKDVKEFAEKMAEFYQEFYNNPDNFDDELDEFESISVAYWEIDNIAMCADFCTSDQIYDMLPQEFFENANKTLKHVLFSGNDNNPGLILEDEVSLLTVEERILLAKFMGYEQTIWVCEDDHKEEYLHGFSEEDIERLKENLQNKPSVKVNNKI